MRHVQHLNAAADRKDWQIGLERKANQSDLVFIATGFGWGERRVCRLAVERRIHIAATSQQENAAKDLKTAEETIGNLKKELKKAERTRDEAENKYFQSTLTLRRQVKSTLDKHSNAGRARRDHKQATAELASARKAAEAMTQPILAIAFSLDN